MKQRHDAARRSRFDGANEEADANTDATTRRRDDGANAEADGNNDGTDDAARRKPRIESSIIYYITYY